VAPANDERTLALTTWRKKTETNQASAPVQATSTIFARSVEAHKTGARGQAGLELIDS